MVDSTHQSLRHKSSFINGTWHQSAQTFAVNSPADGSLITAVCEVTEQQLLLAIEGAEQAQQKWRKVSANERAAILNRWQLLIENHIDELALLLTQEQGKTLADAKSEIQYGCSFIQWFAEEGRRIEGDVIPSASVDKRIFVTKEPVGVVAAITPWNFPNAMITRKAAAAFAAGCSFIVKPAAETPLSALAIAGLAQQAGLPDGLFNVVVGTQAQTIGQVLTQHPKINKFTFTGSTKVGKILTAQCASTIKKVSMELGGNAPCIVFADANIDLAIRALLANKLRNCGQTCVSINRIYLHKSIINEFSKKLVEQLSALTQGHGESADSDIACLIHQQAAVNIHHLVAKTLSEGATLLLGGLDHPPTSAFYPPTVLQLNQHDCDITKTEIFGPVFSLMAFDSDEEVIKQANDTELGLASYFFTENMRRVIHMSEALNFGMVGVNDAVISNAAAPFGGVKQSGYGREGSKYGLDDYLNIKYVCLGGL